MYIWHNLHQATISMGNIPWRTPYKLSIHVHVGLQFFDGFQSSFLLLTVLGLNWTVTFWHTKNPNLPTIFKVNITRNRTSFLWLTTTHVHKLVQDWFLLVVRARQFFLSMGAFRWLVRNINFCWIISKGTKVLTRAKEATVYVLPLFRMRPASNFVNRNL